MKLSQSTDREVETLVAASLRSWGVDGTVTGGTAGGLVVRAGTAEIRVARAPPLPFRWVVAHGGRERGAASVVGVLRLVRSALVPDWRPGRLRIAAPPESEPTLGRRARAQRQWQNPAAASRQRVQPLGSGPIAHPIPVTVLTGYLGSGKTTLLARLLKHPALARTAVIINELGAVGIDHDLVEAGEESFVELETGCICCRSRGDLEATLADLMARRAHGRVQPFERIVIETSGVADPAPVLQALMLEEARGGDIALGRVVTLVDAVTGPALLSEEAQPPRQVAAADIVLITKTDLTNGPPASLLGQLEAINPSAQVEIASFGDVDPGLLLDAVPPRVHAEPAADAARGGEAARAIARLPPSALLQFTAAAARSRAPAPGAHRHDRDLAAHVVRRVAPIRAATLPLLFEALAEQHGGNLLRLKGLVAIAERPDEPAVIHGVQHLFHAPVWLDAWPSSDQETRLVLIGRGIAAAWVERLIEALEAEVAEVAG